MGSLYAEQGYAWEWARALRECAALSRTKGAGLDPQSEGRLLREAQELLKGL